MMVTSPDLQQVLRVLSDTDKYPAQHPSDARLMLAHGLPEALPLFGEEQHQYQKDIVDLTEKVLDELLQACTEASLNSAAVIQECEAQLANCKADHDNAVSVTAAARGESKEKIAAHVLAKKQLVGFEAEQELVGQNHNEVATQLSELQAKKQNADEIVKALEDNQVGTSPADVSLANLVTEYLQSVKAEKALIAAVPGVLKCQPSERRGFDALAFETIKEVVCQSANALSTEVATAAKEERYAEAEALGAWAVADVERDKLNKLSDARAEAQRNLQQAEAAEAAAVHAAASQVEAVRKAVADQTAAEEKVTELKQQILEAFERLKSPKEPVALESPVKDVEQPVAMEVEAPTEIAEVPAESVAVPMEGVEATTMET